MNPQYPYPIDSLYSLISDAAREVRDNLKAPDALIGNSFLTAMSIACQGEIDVELPTGQIRPVSLDIITIADSGERKTATDSIVCAPIYAHDEAQSHRYAEAQLEYQADLRFWKACDASIQRKIVKSIDSSKDADHLRRELVAHGKHRPSKPVHSRIVYQNITERPLLNALQGDGKSVAILSDEGEIILKGGAMNRMGTLNKAWDGANRLTFDRADESIAVTNPRLTISLMAQERVFSDFLEKRGQLARSNGHLARYLIAWPKSTQGFRFMSLQEPVWASLSAFHRRVSALLEQTNTRRATGDLGRKVLTFSGAAKELWVQAQNDVEFRLRAGGDYVSIRDFASKSMEIASRVAGILSYFGEQSGDTISVDTLKRALDIVRWHTAEFLRLFGDQATPPQRVKDTEALQTYLTNKYWQRGQWKALWNDIRKYGPIRRQDRFEAALNELSLSGAVNVMYESTSPRHRPRRIVTPGNPTSWL